MLLVETLSIDCKIGTFLISLLSIIVNIKTFIIF